MTNQNTQQPQAVQQGPTFDEFLIQHDIAAALDRVCAKFDNPEGAKSLFRIKFLAMFEESKKKRGGPDMAELENLKKICALADVTAGQMFCINTLLELQDEGKIKV